MLSAAWAPLHADCLKVPPPPTPCLAPQPELVPQGTWRCEVTSPGRSDLTASDSFSQPLT